MTESDSTADRLGVFLMGVGLGAVLVVTLLDLLGAFAPGVTVPLAAREALIVGSLVVGIGGGSVLIRDSFSEST